MKFLNYVDHTHKKNDCILIKKQMTNIVKKQAAATNEPTKDILVHSFEDIGSDLLVSLRKIKHWVI